MARVVLNHSTFVPGLKAILMKLKPSDLFTTITPGRIFAKGNVSTAKGKANSRKL
jgi:hypothetical protein